MILRRMFEEFKYYTLAQSSSNTYGSSEIDLSCRQIMVTASPILCEAIKRSYRNLCSSDSVIAMHENADGINESKNDDFDDGHGSDDSELEDVSFRTISEEKYPLIITYSMFLAMLNRSLPKPLFSAEDVPKMVTFERFQSHYFPMFDESLYGDVNLIFSEITTNIKGSLAALRSMKGYISQTEYVALSDNRATSNLTKTQREMIYKAFMKYDKLKRELFRDYDHLDLVHHVYRTVKSNQIVFPHIRSVYVDEVQDLTPAEIALFGFVCPNPKGFVFAGDTAQTVSYILFCALLLVSCIRKQITY